MGFSLRVSAKELTNNNFPNSSWGRLETCPTKLVADQFLKPSLPDSFMSRLLSGQTVLVTRPGEQAHELRQLLSEQGAFVLEHPCIQVADPEDWHPVDQALDRLKEFDWIVFSSGNGVRHLLDRLHGRHGSSAGLGSHKLAAIGPGTAAELARYGLTAHVVPVEYRAEALAEALAPFAAGKRFLLARANRGRDVLPNELKAAGAVVEQIVVYSTYDVTELSPEIAQAFANGSIDWVTVTSSSIARAVVGLMAQELPQTRLASISPVTTAVLKELGFPPQAEAKEYTMPGLVAAIVEASK